MAVGFVSLYDNYGSGYGSETYSPYDAGQTGYTDSKVGYADDKTGYTDDKKSGKSSPEECETCKHRKYVDGSDEAAAQIKAGKMTGTALQQFALMAEMAVTQADGYLKNGTTGLDEKQLVDCIAITADNVDKLSAFVYTE